MSEKSNELTIGNILVMLISTVFGFVLAEAVYRVVLLESASDRFDAARAALETPANVVAAYNKSHWSYSEPFGYEYPASRKLIITHVDGSGKHMSCNNIDVINERGGIGPIVGDYATADHKILVFGDSWTAFNHDGITWTHKLQDELEKRLGQKVHVVNFGRDGYGVLQMVDLAAAKIEEYKPDMAIIAFITNDLERVRTWRAETTQEGYERVITSFAPGAEPDLSKSYDTFIIHPGVTQEWCDQETAKGDQREPTPVGIEIVRRMKNAKKLSGQRNADIWTLTHSYLWARVTTGNPFDSLPTMFEFPRVKLESYGDDPQFVANWERIRKSGTKVVFLHLAFYPEVKEQKEYIVNFAEEKLLASLPKVTGLPIEETLPYISLPLENPERMNHSETNFHPSLFGQELYAKAASEMLIKRGYLAPASQP